MVAGKTRNKLCKGCTLVVIYVIDSTVQRSVQASRIHADTPTANVHDLGAHGPLLLPQDYDDDGEDAAGGRLLHLLQILDVKNAVVVVSRWYGGIKLGPARFTHINNAARLLLEKCGYLQAEKVTAATKRKGKRH